MEKLAARCAADIRKKKEEQGGAVVENKLKSKGNSHMLSLMDEMCLSFEDLDLQVLLKLGTPLLANSGKEYDVEEYEANLTDDEKLKEARKRLDKNIGLSGATTFFDSSEIVSNQDLVIESVVKKEEGEGNRVAVSSLMPAKKRQKQDESSGEKRKEGKEESASGSVVKEVDQLSVLQCFEICSRDFGAHMFDEHWDIRHGAALGLRALLCTFKQLLFRDHQMHIKGEGGLEEETNSSNSWHVDFGVRLICILALDRLGDFFSEKTSAPVKETAAQTLGFLISFLGESSR